MARNNVRLINYHTSGTTAPKKEDMVVGEIAVGKDLIWSYHNANEELSVFISSGAVHSAISAATTDINGTINALSTKVEANTKKFGDYATSAETVAADEKVLSSAKTYTDLLKAKEGETYSGETLAGLKSEINSLKGNSDTSIGALASRVTTAEGKITTLETTVGNNKNGLVKDVADLKTKFNSYATSADTVAADTKTLNDAKSYTDSQINAIKGDSYKTGTTLASLESNLGTEKLRIDAILQDAPSGLTSFKDVEDEINLKISSVYKVRGTKNTYADLPTENNTIGDVYNVVQAVGTPGTADYTPAGTNYVCTKTTGNREEQWDALGGTVDLSTYATKTYVNDALTGVTGTGPDSIVTRLRTAETNIDNLKESASTLDEDVQTIKGWKINGSAITNSTVLNGGNLKVDATEGAKTLNEAIAAAAQSGSNANNAFTAWTAGTYSENQAAINTKFGKIDAYTVNGTRISDNPVLTGENVLVGGESANSAKTLNATIAEAKAAGTAASEAITALRDGYEGTIKSINDSVTTNTSDITKLKTDVTNISSKANSAVQTITVTHTETNKITATKAKDSTEVVLNFDNMVIDSGEF